MEFHVDNKLTQLGVKEIAIGIVHNINPSLILNESLLQLKHQSEKKALETDLLNLQREEVILGYRELTSLIGRSIKKNLPTAEALYGNIQHRQQFPSINSVVDIYNMETIRSYLSIGAHDLDKIEFPIRFEVSDKSDMFYPISSPCKKLILGTIFTEI